MRLLAMTAWAITMALGISGCSSTSSNPGQTNKKNTGTESASLDTTIGKSTYTANLEEMDRTEYPDNPNWGYTAEEYGDFAYDKVRIEPEKGTRFDMKLLPSGEDAFPITLEDIDLSVYTPQAPSWVQDDEYLTRIGLVNQEWNRQQVRFSPEHFEVKGSGPVADSITRVDVARNCLNAGLWEVIAYKKEGGQERPVYHGWFDFPRPLYSKLFERANELPYEEYRKPMERWVEPENKKVDLSKLREVQKEWTLDFENLNDEFYPLKGSRKKKYENIIRPKRPDTIQEMLNDSTLFATFDQPGYYNVSNPRHTQLGKLAHPKEVTLRRTNPMPVDEPRYEIDIRFLHNNGEEETRLVIGGLNLAKVPRLKEDELNKGFKMPMGISNHSFYESYEKAQERPVGDNPYFGMLLNGQGKWLDSHKVGIDGPMLHWDAEDKNVLHFYILSFERHAYVGHFELEMPKEVVKRTIGPA